MKSNDVALYRDHVAGAAGSHAASALRRAAIFAMERGREPVAFALAHAEERVLSRTANTIAFPAQQGCPPQERGYEYVAPSEWPKVFDEIRCHNQRLAPLRSALWELRSMKAYEGVRLPVRKGESSRYLQKVAWLYAKRYGFAVRTKTFKGFLYIQRREAK